MVKKLILGGVLVLTLALVPLASDWSNPSIVLAKTASTTEFKSPLPPPHHPHPRPCRHGGRGPLGRRCQPPHHFRPHR